MLERPGDVRDDQIAACLKSAYDLTVTEVAFLPLGADVDTAVYRVAAGESSLYLLKLRLGEFLEASVTIPHWLAENGLERVIPPLPTITGSLCTELASYTAILYPFVNGRSGWDVALSERHWLELGSALRVLHTSLPPATLTRALPREAYSARWRRQVMAFLRQAAEDSFEDPVSKDLADLLVSNEDTIRRMVDRVEELARSLLEDRLELCLCHGDIHAGNVLVDAADRVYLVDWDTLVTAPKERDLMFIGGGVGGKWNRDDEIKCFYRGYGEAPIHLAALTYYRYERIVQDIAAFCEQLWGSLQGDDDRAAALGHLVSQFDPGDVVDIAFRTDEELQLQIK